MIGIDIVEVERIKHSLKNKNFVNKILTSQEINYVSQFKDKEAHIAGFFACKEAVMKALEDCKQIGFSEIEILHKDNGKPYVELYGKAKEVFIAQNLNNIEVSISQTNNYACAVCQIR